MNHGCSSRRTFEDGQYIRFLLDWYETFPSEQILVVESSKLITPMALMHEVSAFLQLDLKVSSENFVFDAGFLLLFVVFYPVFVVWLMMRIRKSAHYIESKCSLVRRDINWGVRKKFVLP